MQLLIRERLVDRVIFEHFAGDDDVSILYEVPLIFYFNT